MTGDDTALLDEALSLLVLKHNFDAQATDFIDTSRDWVVNAEKQKCKNKTIWLQLRT